MWDFERSFERMQDFERSFERMWDHYSEGGEIAILSQTCFDEKLQGEQKVGRTRDRNADIDCRNGVQDERKGLLVMVQTGEFSN